MQYLQLGDGELYHPSLYTLKLGKEIAHKFQISQFTVKGQVLIIAQNK